MEIVKVKIVCFKAKEEVQENIDKLQEEGWEMTDQQLDEYHKMLECLELEIPYNGKRISQKDLDELSHKTITFKEGDFEEYETELYFSLLDFSTIERSAEGDYVLYLKSGMEYILKNKKQVNKIWKRSLKDS